jgi:hypothetical protein
MTAPNREVFRGNPTPPKLKILPALPPTLLLTIMVLNIFIMLHILNFCIDFIGKLSKTLSLQ